MKPEHEMQEADVPDPVRGASTERLILFTDAVVAIAITLLALELPVPDGGDWSAFWHSVSKGAGHYLAFLISFEVIGGLWLQHRRLFEFVDGSDRLLDNLTLRWLMGIVLIPFASKLLTAGAESNRWVEGVLLTFYAALQVAIGTVFLIMVRHVDKAGLLSSKTPPELITKAAHHAVGLIVGFTASIPVLFVTKWGWLVWALAPIAYKRIMTFLRHRRPAQSDE
jgi:uncharacterized membrane protein